MSPIIRDQVEQLINTTTKVVIYHITWGPLPLYNFANQILKLIKRNSSVRVCSLMTWSIFEKFLTSCPSVTPEWLLYLDPHTQRHKMVSPLFPCCMTPSMNNPSVVSYPVHSHLNWLGAWGLNVSVFAVDVMAIWTGWVGRLVAPWGGRGGTEGRVPVEAAHQRHHSVFKGHGWN